MPCAIQYKINICCYFSKLKSDVKLFLLADSGTKKELSSYRGGCILCWEKILERTKSCADGAGGGRTSRLHSGISAQKDLGCKHRGWVHLHTGEHIPDWMTAMELPLSPRLSQHTRKNKEVFGYPHGPGGKWARSRTS